MDENEFELHGVEYRAERANICAEHVCEGCAFEDDSVKCLQSPDCHADYRSDESFVIFVVKQ